MPENQKKSSVIMVTSYGMSNADKELSHVLLSNYLKLLSEQNLLPNAILFYGEGVKTVVASSPFIESLENLENKGVKLIVCKTCLNFYGILNKVKIGSIGSMSDIINYQWNVEKVISI